jgi:hypothetical protein
MFVYYSNGECDNNNVSFFISFVQDCLVSHSNAIFAITYTQLLRETCDDVASLISARMPFACVDAELWTAAVHMPFVSADAVTIGACVI